ncbi:type II toxin-antitoxin system VapC family toxin [Moorella sp. Hama-1]|uniref:type II toxin-antitoxin system VapC family toxin n=1 Tax=Moorella sp. Hama-1 TaxID=2138101 RepID=UPI000D64CC25|nr:PIN domain-containing protein [Moorella sp. Hama-1]BCV23007.1 hypothetical protein hamaS1_30760 [Moorella sp. Hama-1]
MALHNNKGGEIQRTKSKLITTTAVLLEIGNSLARQRYRSAAIKLLNALESDPTIKIINMSGKIYQAALRLYRERQDKEWGLTDCASFVVMQQKGLKKALTKLHQLGKNPYPYIYK